MNIYTPQKNPNAAFLLVSLTALIGILGGVFISTLIIVIALIFWIQYTAILSYLQFKKDSKHNFKSITQSLLVPQFRFFLFEMLAVMGIIAVIKYNSTIFGIASLIGWWLFALNFYLYYKPNYFK